MTPRATTRRLGSILAGAIILAVAAAACGPVAPRSTFPPAGSTPQAPGEATVATKQAVLMALAAAGLQATDAAQAYRPPEGALLAAAPRSVLQVALPDDPDHGYVLIYAFASPEAAAAAARDHAGYVASSIGKAYYPPGTRFVLRQVGSTVVFFHWLPANAPDARTPALAQALETVGTEVPIGG